VRATGTTLAAVLLLGCGPSSTYHGAASYSAEERADIEAAATIMAERTRGDPYTIVWDDGDAGDSRILRQLPTDRDVDGEFTMSSESYARTIYLNPTLAVGRLGRVAAHEFGHSFGLNHLPEAEPGLMNPLVIGEWNSADMAACRAVGRC